MNALADTTPPGAVTAVELDRLPQLSAVRHRRPVRVLIADDAADVRFLLRCKLDARADMTVLGEACDGAEAIKQAEALRPDIVLLDLSMPVMDGLQALPELRRRVPEAAVVVVSGFSSSRMRSQALSLGAAEYVEKDAPLHELLAVINAAVVAAAAWSSEQRHQSGVCCVDRRRDSVDGAGVLGRRSGFRWIRQRA